MNHTASILQSVVRQVFEPHKWPSYTEFDVLISQDQDGYDLRGWWMSGTGRDAVCRSARYFIPASKCRSAPSLLDVVTRGVNCILAQLHPPRVPFRIGTRSTKRLQFARRK